MKTPNLLINNTSRYTDENVRLVVNFAARSVLAVPGRLHRGDQVVVKVQNTCHAWSGHAKPWRDTVLLRIGRPSQFPNNWTYERFQDMPEIHLEDWLEALVCLAAHELAHVHYQHRGGCKKDQEFKAELAASDALDEWRHQRDQVWAEEMKRREQITVRKLTVASRQQTRQEFLNSPQYKLSLALEDEKRWLRKLKLAETKLKLAKTKLRKTQARVRRYERIIATAGAN